MRRAAIYKRRSKDKQAVSLEVQDETCREYAAAAGYTVDPVHVYVDTESGGETFGRKGVMRMIDAAKRGEFEVVVCHKLDRLTRNDNFRGWLLSELDHAGVGLYFSTEQYGTNLPGRLMMSFNSNLSEEERQNISSRCRRAYEKELDQGTAPKIGPAPYGYTKVQEWIKDKHGTRLVATGELLVDEEEAEVVRRVFRWVREGLSVCAVVRRLEAEGVPPPSASEEKNYGQESRAGTGRWVVVTVANMIRNSVYKGQRPARRQRSIAVSAEGVDPEVLRARKRRDNPSHMLRRPQADWLYFPCPALVSVEEWDAAVSALDSRKGVFQTRNEARPALLRGLIVCAGCGQPMAPDWQYGSRLVYRCSSRNKPEGSCGRGSVQGEAVEAAAWQQVAGFLADPASVLHELKQQQERGPDPKVTAALKRLGTEREKAKLKQARLVDLYAEGGLTMDAVKDSLAQVGRDTERLDSEIAELERRLQAQAATTMKVRSLIVWCQAKARTLGQTPFAEKRRLMEELGVVVQALKPTKRNGWPISSLEMRIPVRVGEAMKARDKIGAVNSAPWTPIQNAETEPLRITLGPPLDKAA